MKLPTPFQEQMTDAMLAILPELEDVQNEILMCHKKALEADNAAAVSLPMKNERGISVIHGTRVVIDNIREYWIARRDHAIHLLPRNKEMDDWCDNRGFSNISYGHLRRPK